MGNSIILCGSGLADPSIDRLSPAGPLRGLPPSSPAFVYEILIIASVSAQRWAAPVWWQTNKKSPSRVLKGELFGVFGPSNWVGCVHNCGQHVVTPQQKKETLQFLLVSFQKPEIKPFNYQIRGQIRDEQQHHHAAVASTCCWGSACWQRPLSAKQPCYFIFDKTLSPSFFP